MCTDNLKIYPDITTMAGAAFNMFAKTVKQVLANRDICRVALSGGSTPDSLFKLFAADNGKSILWEKVELFWVDERLVPLDNEFSNFGRAEKLFIKPLKIDKANIHPATENYAQELRRLCSDRLRDGFPVFDLMLLGMGSDGHTASLFPGAEALLENEKAVLLVPAPKTVTPQVPRVTLTLPVINRSEKIIFMVSGHEKIALLSYIASLDVIKYPVQLVKNEHICWLATE